MKFSSRQHNAPGIASNMAATGHQSSGKKSFCRSNSSGSVRVSEAGESLESAGNTVGYMLSASVMTEESIKKEQLVVMEFIQALPQTIVRYALQTLREIFKKLSTQSYESSAPLPDEPRTKKMPAPALRKAGVSHAVCRASCFSMILRNYIASAKGIAYPVTEL
ncbi:hypothetical protein KJ068_18215 [bacterium]|nr:hypothetical protein [bacterium]